MASPSYETARVRKLQVETALAEMDLAKARREYVSASDVKHVWADVLEHEIQVVIDADHPCADVGRSKRRE